MSTRLIELVDRMAGRTVLLAGDFMIDRYLYGNAERLSPEAPVPVLHYQNEEIRLGGAGSVAADLAALGAKVRAVGLVGADPDGQLLRQKLQEFNIDATGLIEVAGRPTTCKLRLVGSAQHRHPQQLMRLDFEDATPIDGPLVDQMLKKIQQGMESAEMIAIEDYHKGALPPAVCRGIIEMAKKANKPVIVDPSAAADYSQYAGATAIKLNRTEAAKMLGSSVNSPDQFRAAAEVILYKLDLQAVILTLDKQGAYLATRTGERQWLKTRPRQVFDVTGAGDMALAVVALARAAGSSWAEAVELANVAGGLEVERFGSVPIAPSEIVQELLGDLHQRLGKQRKLDQLLPELQHRKNAGQKIVFTNGCFDLIHLGHVKYFQFAKRQGDVLVVAVNTDSSIRQLKGNKRPIIVAADRLGVLEEFESIDYIVLFDDSTPIDLIQRIRPDVLVKGADYPKEKVVGWDLVESYGGRVALAPLVDGQSTSAVIQRILDAYQT